MNKQKLSIYKKITKYGLKIAPAYNEDTHTISEWAVFSEIEGGYWCSGSTLQSAVEEWEKVHGKI